MIAAVSTGRQLLVRGLEARPDLRMAAARVLFRHHGESPHTLLRGLDAQLRAHAGAAAEPDPERAAQELDRLGPLFTR